ncbi:MAG: OmpA family protein [Acidobacteriia bacterium]|nr:OmpA family protein [Terriglobia bacterium]
MRRPKHPEQENHERWLVSYADFITLLFAFFVVMFASTQADKAKAKAVSESVKNALENGQFSAAVSVMLGRGKHQASTVLTAPPKDSAHDNQPAAPGPPQPHPPDLAQAMASLEHGLQVEIAGGKVQLKLETRGLVISLREAAFFGSGDDALSPASVPILARIAAVIRSVPNPMRLEGYTDAVPIHNSRFRSNWELSAARSVAMLELLRQRFDVPPARMSVAGYAENAPVDTNETDQGRAHNRRVDIVLLSAEGVKAEPRAQGPRVGGQESGPQSAPQAGR